jgi:hypothetical protein
VEEVGESVISPRLSSKASMSLDKVLISVVVRCLASLSKSTGDILQGESSERCAAAVANRIELSKFEIVDVR